MNNRTTNDEQLYIPEALHALIMQIEAARIECSRMQATMQQSFVETYDTLPAVPVHQKPRESGVVIDAKHRFMARSAQFMNAFSQHL